MWDLMANLAGWKIAHGVENPESLLYLLPPTVGLTAGTIISVVLLLLDLTENEQPEFWVDEDETWD